MGNTRNAYPAGTYVSSEVLRGEAKYARSPGSLGIHDDADPRVKALPGDTPGPTGTNSDASTQLHGAELVHVTSDAPEFIERPVTDLIQTIAAGAKGVADTQKKVEKSIQKVNDTVQSAADVVATGAQAFAGAIQSADQWLKKVGQDKRPVSQIIHSAVVGKPPIPTSQSEPAKIPAAAAGQTPKPKAPKVGGRTRVLQPRPRKTLEEMIEEEDRYRSSSDGGIRA